LLFIGLQLRQVWVFRGLWVTVLPGASEHPGPAALALEVSPSLPG